MYGAVQLFAQIPSGRLSDRVGRKPPILLGLGSGMSNPAASAMVADVASPARRGEIFGVFNTFRMGGAVLGALVAGLTADVYGIGGSIVAFLIIAALITVGSAAIRDPRNSKPKLKPKPI